MKLLLNFLKLIPIFLLTLTFSNISISAEKNYYKDLVTDWSRIFPDNNRNAAGPKFFKYIIDKDITYNDFVEYNKLYCAVSGSLIDPNSTAEFVNISEEKTGKQMCGNYYRCCEQTKRRCSTITLKFGEKVVKRQNCQKLTHINTRLFFVLKIIKDLYFRKKLRRDIVDPLNI